MEISVGRVSSDISEELISITLTKTKLESQQKIQLPSQQNCSLTYTQSAPSIARIESGFKLMEKLCDQTLEQEQLAATKKKIPVREDDSSVTRSPKIDHNRQKTRLQLFIDVAQINNHDNPFRCKGRTNTIEKNILNKENILFNKESSTERYKGTLKNLSKVLNFDMSKNNSKNSSCHQTRNNFLPNLHLPCNRHNASKYLAARNRSNGSKKVTPLTTRQRDPGSTMGNLNESFKEFAIQRRSNSTHRKGCLQGQKKRIMAARLAF